MFKNHTGVQSEVSTYFRPPLPSPPPSLSLLLLFSSRLCRFSSLSRASSSSCCWRHLWKFSTTTPTNMLSTKKLTMRRNEMKNSSIQGLLFLIGCREEKKIGGVRRGGKVARGQKEEEEEEYQRVTEEGEERLRGRRRESTNKTTM